MTINLEKIELSTRPLKVLEALRKDDVLNAVCNLIEPQRSYGVVISETPYDLERYKGDAIDYENLLLSVPLWASNTLETDEFSKRATEKLLLWQEQNKEHFWDYNIGEWLSENDFYELDEEICSGYTYNDSNYNRLDRDIHYTTFKYDGDYYVCFSIHHGADARVGFSDSIILAIKDESVFHYSMEITVYDNESDMDYLWYDLDEIARFENGEWILNESNKPLSIYSGANGL